MQVGMGVLVYPFGGLRLLVFIVYFLIIDSFVLLFHWFFSFILILCLQLVVAFRVEFNFSFIWLLLLCCVPRGKSHTRRFHVSNEIILTIWDYNTGWYGLEWIQVVSVGGLILLGSNTRCRVGFGYWKTVKKAICKDLGLNLVNNLYMETIGKRTQGKLTNSELSICFIPVS